MFKQINDVLNEINLVYDNLYKSYENLQKFLKDEKSQEVMHYIKNKKASFREMLNQYKKSGQDEVLRTWLQFSPEHALGNRVADYELKDDADIDRLNQVVVQVEKWLADFYEYVITTTSSSKTKEVFRKLLERQEKDNKTLSAVINTFQDI